LAEPHTRRSIRLPSHDYAGSGAYFVTLCTRDRLLLFGEVLDAEMRLTALGESIATCWQWLAEQYEYISLDAFVVMPDHLHGIVLIADPAVEAERDAMARDCAATGGSRTAPTRRIGPPTPRKVLGRLIGPFKTVSTKRVNELRGEPGLMLWQRNYYEHIIRSERALNRIRQYIIDNPARWHDDPEDRKLFQEFGITSTAR